MSKGEESSRAPGNRLPVAKAREQEDAPGSEERAVADRISRQLDRVAAALDRSSLAELVELYRRPRRMLFLSLVSGIFRGVGTAIGFTAVAALVLYFLGRLAALNLPVIGEFVADITRIVERELEMRPGL